jgi:hypothetical protein
MSAQPQVGSQILFLEQNAKPKGMPRSMEESPPRSVMEIRQYHGMAGMVFSPLRPGFMA